MGYHLLRAIVSGTLLFLILSGGAAAVEISEAPLYDNLSPLTLLTFLLPAGLILLSVAALPEDRAAEAAAGAVITWGLACLAYFSAGFALQFGGIAIVDHTPDLSELYWEYSLLDVAWGNGWGMMGLRGFLMAGPAATPGALTLFLSQLPLLGVATLIVHFTAWETTRRWLTLPLGLLMGSIVYPLIGNWIWGGGWLANLGLTLAYGHGLVDAAGGGQVALNGAISALAVASVFRERCIITSMKNKLDVPMPRAHLPLLGWSGALLMAIGWMATSTMTHFPPAVNVVPAVIAVNLALAAFGATFTAGLYTWFVSGQLDVLMMGRALTAGLVVMAAGAPFVPTWGALVAGLLSGLLLPGLLFLFEHRLQIGNAATALATFGVPAILGLLWPGMLADGRYGAGWNRVGVDVYLGISGQGVSGAWLAPGMTPNWPGQLLAQVIGIAAITVWCFFVIWVPLRIMRGIALAWQHSGIEFGTPPPPVPFEEETVPPVEHRSAANPATEQRAPGRIDTLTDGIGRH